MLLYYTVCVIIPLVIKMLNAEKIKSYFTDDIEVFTYDITDSTNPQAKQMLREGLSCNALFVANQQSGGRGRQGKSFYSPASTGLYMSVALQGKSAPDSLFVTSAAAVLVAQAIEELCNVDIKIKWVNDLYIDDKKVCGILTEAVRDVKGVLIGVVVGIGINISTTSFPEEIVATSIGQAVDRNHLCAVVTQKILNADFNDKKILEEYKKRSMVIDRDITYYINNIPHNATAVDIDNNGALVVNSDGQIITLASGEITLRLK